ncbi:hypothetical protein [Acinetobacter boissieri]|uniref:Uncharacterized protein n=1 Tax=Acinetobacter boissieri TaxID=1219383 RepID=A0A1G6KDV0_9GAMM|nr:hypothetical protein [Acinetobacter boissieri]SDC29259.1 hypothetical protein SAMN05421733_1172 [Acinetobacter boissieri]
MKQNIKWAVLIAMAFSQVSCADMTSSNMEIGIDNNLYPNLAAIRAISNSHPDCMRLNKEEKQYYQPHNFPLTSRFCFDENYFPETMVLEYAKWKTDEQYEKELNIVYPARLPDYDVTEYRNQMATINKKIDDDIDKLPASAWHKVIIHPKEMLQEAKKQQRLKGKGYLPSGTELLITIEIQKDGSAIVKTNYHWFSAVGSMTDWAR